MTPYLLPIFGIYIYILYTKVSITYPPKSFHFFEDLFHSKLSKPSSYWGTLGYPDGNPRALCVLSVMLLIKEARETLVASVHVEKWTSRCEG